MGSIHGTLHGNEGFPTSSIILIKRNIQQHIRKLVRKYLFLKIAKRRGNTQSKDQRSTSICDEVERLEKEMPQFSVCFCVSLEWELFGITPTNDPKQKENTFFKVFACLLLFYDSLSVSRKSK